MGRLHFATVACINYALLAFIRQVFLPMKNGLAFFRRRAYC